jgi:hypothetical protein
MEQAINLQTVQKLLSFYRKNCAGLVVYWRFGTFCQLHLQGSKRRAKTSSTLWQMPEIFRDRNYYTPLLLKVICLTFWGLTFIYIMYRTLFPTSQKAKPNTFWWRVKIVELLLMLWAGLAWSVYRLAAGWTVRGSDPGGGEIFCNCQDGREAYPAYSGYRGVAWR